MNKSILEETANGEVEQLPASPRTSVIAGMFLKHLFNFFMTIVIAGLGPLHLTKCCLLNRRKQ